jgi:hypothetical protein
MKIAIETDQGRECPQDWGTDNQFENLRRALIAASPRQRPYHRVRIFLDGDERAAYDFPATEHPFRPRYIDLKWTYPHGRWRLESVAMMGSEVLKSGRLSKRGDREFVVPVGPYARSLDSLELPEPYRRLVKEHAPKDRPKRSLKMVR